MATNSQVQIPRCCFFVDSYHRQAPISTTLSQNDTFSTALTFIRISAVFQENHSEQCSDQHECWFERFLDSVVSIKSFRIGTSGPCKKELPLDILIDQKVHIQFKNALSPFPAAFLDKMLNLR